MKFIKTLFFAISRIYSTACEVLKATRGGQEQVRQRRQSSCPQL